jgi:N-acetylmuramic acid 6-phosphate (MurNAc-6-P) etherase
VKTAIIMIAANVSAEEARQRLEKVNGFVRLAIG